MVVETRMKAAKQGELSLWVSAIAWVELLSRDDGVRAGREKHAAQVPAEAYRRLLADSSTIVTRIVDVAVAEEAARLRRLYRLGGFDAIHIATARIVGATAILGNDEAWRLCPECPEFLCIDELAFGSGV